LQGKHVRGGLEHNAGLPPEPADAEGNGVIFVRRSQSWEKTRPDTKAHSTCIELVTHNVGAMRRHILAEALHQRVDLAKCGGEPIEDIATANRGVEFVVSHYRE